MKKAMISQPMNGYVQDGIFRTKRKAVDYLESKGYIVVNTYFDKYDNSIIQYLNKPLYYLSLSLLRMSACDVVYFYKGWKNARGCRIEHEVAKAYGLEIIYEE